VRLYYVLGQVCMVSPDFGAYGYTLVMHTDVSIPDDVYARAEAYLSRRSITRSELYAEALREYLARHHDDAIIEALDRVYGGSDCSPEPDILAVGVEALKRTEW
jgi:hypothetical protein